MGPNVPFSQLRLQYQVKQNRRKQTKSLLQCAKVGFCTSCYQRLIKRGARFRRPGCCKPWGTGCFAELCTYPSCSVVEKHQVPSVGGAVAPVSWPGSCGVWVGTSRLYVFEVLPSHHPEPWNPLKYVRWFNSVGCRWGRFSLRGLGAFVCAPCIELCTLPSTHRISAHPAPGFPPAAKSMGWTLSRTPLSQRFISGMVAVVGGEGSIP